MKKNFILACLTIFLFVLALASAELISTNKNKISFTKSLNSTSFDITAIDGINLQVSYNYTTILDDEENSLRFFSSTFNGNLPAGNSTSISVYYTADSDFDFELRTYNLGTITLYAVNSSNPSQNETKTLQVELISGFCDAGARGKLKITEVEDDKDFEWEPLEETTIDVEVENNYDDKERVKVYLSLYKLDGKKVNLDIDPITKYIEEDDTEKFSFNVKVPADLDSGKYRLYIKATSSTEDEEACIDNWDGKYYEIVEIVKDDRDVVIDSDNLARSMPFEVSCNQEVSLTLPIYNVGDEDEDKVKVILRNKELGIELENLIENLDASEWKDVEFKFTMPDNATLNKTYNFDLIVYFDYDKDHKAYLDFNPYIAKFKPSSGCKVNKIYQASINATLENNGAIYSGSEVKILSTITNFGKDTATFTISVNGIDSWASVSSINPQIITLAPNENAQVLITLNLDKSAEGEKIFSIKASSDSYEKTQQLSLFVEKSSVLRKAGSWIADNWLMLLIVIVNIILIAAIIILLVKVMRS